MDKLKIGRLIKVFSLGLAVAICAATLFVGFHSCSMIDSFTDSGSSTPSVSITSLTLAKSTLALKVGSIDYISVNIKPQTEQKNVKLAWSYDTSIIECDTSSNWGVTVKGLKEGQTSLRCSGGGIDATCVVTVSGYEEGYEETTEPYIYSNTTVLQTAPGVTERVFVSLYGGDASDIDGYSWTNDNNTVATIQPTGQYCMITAKDLGYTRIKVTHAKAAYPYYIGVYVFGDATKMTYITTSDNILTMNKDAGERTLSVSLVNGKETSLDSSFMWEITNVDSGTTPIGISKNGNKCVVTPVANGSCTLRVTHPDAPYPLDILCRVITIVKNVYIEPDITVATLDGETQQTVTSTLKNIDMSQYSIDDYKYALDNYNAAEIVSWVGNQVVVKGKANGSCKLIISHDKAKYSREVLLIVTGQLTDAVDASCYITTSDNYIRTKVGAEPTKINVSLRGGEDGDENNFVWSVKSTPVDGISDVIELATTHGSATYSKSAAPTYIAGEAHITPKAEGSAVITIKHPKIYYPTEILVKVLNKDAILEEPLYFVGSGLLRIVNGETKDYTVELKGKNKSASDDLSISWSKSEGSKLTINANANTASVTAPSLGTGQTVSKITAKHNKADADKTVLVLTADTEEELLKMKALYADKLYYNFEVGKKATVICNSVGFDGDENDINFTPYDWTTFTWSVSDPSIVSVEKSEYNPLICEVTGLKAGITKLTGSINDVGQVYSCEYTLTVYPKGTVMTDPEVYLTTAQNVVSLGKKNDKVTVNVTAVNLSGSKYSDISWEIDNSSVATVQPNGNKAAITAVADGEAVVTVSHPDSQNQLKVYVRVGSEYVMKPAEPVTYIAAQDVITMLRDDPPQKLEAALVNYSGISSDGFSFAIDNAEVAELSAQSPNGTAFVKPVGSGQAQITITHPDSEIDKKILVVVGNSAEELAGFTYLTTSANVVAIGEGNTKSVSVTVKNAETPVLDGYTWSSNNDNIVSVTPSGSTAVLKGNSMGTCLITVRNSACKYPLEIIAQVVDPKAAADNPYIQLSKSVLTLTVGPTYTEVTADLVGGTESDYSDFVWTTNDSSIAIAFGQNEVGKIQAKKAGTTYVTVSHRKSAYSAQLLVVCDEVKTGDCYISVSPSSIITMKPTDSAQTITASLVGGTANDKYNFKWSLDVYDVVDFTYSANICQVTPKTTGSVTITLSHPKAAYDQQIHITVQQYNTFAFPSDNMTIQQGDVQFLGMQVPTTSIATRVEYSVENPSICRIEGTKKTAQLTAVGCGTTTIKAKLIASSTNTVQAESEMLVYVKERESGAVYITASSTIATVNKGKSQSLSASLVGSSVNNADQASLKWTTSDSDIIQVAGIDAGGGFVSGPSIYITALKPGEAIITCSHEKAASNLQFYVVVPGAAEKVVSLNKTYLTILKGSSGAQLKASIENAESSADYYQIQWSVENIGSNEICRVMGSGQNVTIYPVNVGKATVMAQLPDSSVVAKCDVIVEANKSFIFETQTRRVQPFHTKKVKYIVSPVTDHLTWTYNSLDDYFTFTDLGADEEGVGYLEIEGIKEGSGAIGVKTDSGATGTLSVTIAWDYEFNLTGKTAFKIEPVETQEITYKVSPVDADIHVNSSGLDTIFKCESVSNGDGTGTVKIIPLTESGGDFAINISATNPKKGGEEVGSKSITANFGYDSVTPKIKVVRIDGAWSEWNEKNNILTVGDGETVTMAFGVEETNANAFVSKVEWLRNGNEETPITFFAHQAGAGGETTLYDIKNGNDKLTYDYLITRLVVPTDGSDWKTDYCWGQADVVSGGCQDCFTLDKISHWPSCYPYPRGGNAVYAKDDDDYCWSWGSGNPPKRVATELVGMTMTEKEFKNCAWLYCPGTASMSMCGTAGGSTYDNNGHPIGTYSGTSARYWPITQEKFDNGTLTHGGFGSGYRPSWGPFVMTDHVSYVLIPTTNTTESHNSGYKGQLAITLTHNGHNQKPYYINVYSSERECAMYYNTENCQHLNWEVIPDDTVEEGYIKIRCKDCGYITTVKSPESGLSGPKNGE